MNKVAYFVALNRKYFEQEGLTVDSTAFASGTAALQNLIGGNADVVEGSFEHTLRMQTKGQHLMCIAVFGRYPANVLVVRKSQADKIRTIADLKGRKIGISAPGSSTHNFVAGLMERAGVPYREASFISVGTGLSAVAAMRSGGELDAVVNLDPAINALVDNGDAVVLADSRTEEGTRAAFGGPYLADCLYAKIDFVKANPNTAQAIANAIVHAMQWLRTASIDDIIKSLPPEYYQADEKLYRKSLEKNLSAFQWDGIVSDEAVRERLERHLDPRAGAEAGQGRLRPDLRQQVHRAGAREVQGAAQGVSASAASLPTVFQLRPVPRVPSFFSINDPVSFERPIPFG